MAINQVIFGTTVLIDLSRDTVEPENLASGITAHGADGTTITGTAALVYNAQTEELTLPDWLVTINA